MQQQPGRKANGEKRETGDLMMRRSGLVISRANDYLLLLYEPNHSLQPLTSLSVST
jgi:hypothetical protein